MVDDGVKRRIDVVGGALIADPDVAALFGVLMDYFGDARLPDAGLARKQGNLTLAALGLIPTVEQKCHLLLAPDQWRQPPAGHRLEAAARRCFAPHPIDADGLGEAFQGPRPQVIADEEALHECQRTLADQDGPGLGKPFEAGGQVRRVADDRQCLAGLPGTHFPGDDQAGVNAQVHLQIDRRADRPAVVQAGHLGHQLQAGAHRPCRVVLVGMGIAEVDQQAIADVLGDVSLVAGDHVGAGPLIGLQDLAQLLRVETLRQRGGAGQIAEHDGELPALRLRRDDRGRPGIRRGFRRHHLRRRL